MRDRKLIFFLTVCIATSLIFQNFGYSQSLSTKKKKAIALYKEADKYKVRGQYKRAIPLLQGAIEKDKKFIEAYLLLGVMHKYMRDFSLSNKTLEAGLQLIQKTEKQQIFLFELGDNYLRTGDYQQSLNYLEQYLKNKIRSSPKINLAYRWKQNAQYALNNKQEWPSHKPRFMSKTINQFKMQYFPVLTADNQTLIYTRRKSVAPNADEDLVISKKSLDGKWMPPVSISKNINSTSNEGTCAVSADGRLLILTSCTGRKGYGSCDLFFSKKMGNEWSLPINMGRAVNSEAWESQPSLSADGRTLYFASDRKGGLGGKDVYVSYRGENGQWMEAKNMGQIINTPYDEISPFIHASGRVFFFASNGRPGFGGYDIYKSMLKDAKWEPALNLGSILNDYEDQFSFIMTADGKKAYYSYEKGVYRNASRLVEIDIPEELQLGYKSNVVKGTVRDKKTNYPLNAHIELFDLKENKLISVIESDSINGQYLITLTHGSDYALYTNAKGYLFQSLNFNYAGTSNVGKIVIKDIYLEKANVGATALLSNVYFKFNHYELSEKSRVELRKITTYMTENSRVSIEIGGYTDNLGTDTYNKELSLKRAQAVATYLVDNGIQRNRLLAKGYGADRPIQPNDTEANRRLNRRIEFKIIQL